MGAGLSLVEREAGIHPAAPTPPPLHSLTQLSHIHNLYIHYTIHAGNGPPVAIYRGAPDSLDFHSAHSRGPV